MDLEFHPLAWEHKTWLDGLFHSQPPSLSEYTFSNLYAWRGHYGFEIARWGEMAVLRASGAGGKFYFYPWGPGDLPGLVRQLLAGGGRITRIPEDAKARLAPLGKLEPALDRDNSDYVYLTSDLAGFPGRHYDGKRNLIRKFKSLFPGYAYVPLNPGNVRDCQVVEDAWCVEKDCDHTAGLAHERDAIREMLDRFGELSLSGGAIWAEGRCRAVALGEALNPETLVVHILKAEPGLPGLYQVMLSEFAAHAGSGLAWVNLEQDLGVEGLRRAKEGYRPRRMEWAYTLAATAGKETS